MRNRKSPNNRSREAGFSLIELMVVVTIIGVLGAIAVPRYISYVRSSETAEVGQTAGQIVNAIVAYADAQNMTPDSAKTQFDGKVLTQDGTNTLAAIIPQLNLPKRALFNYSVSAIVATDGAQNGDLVLCIQATGRAATTGVGAGVPSGIVLYSSSPAKSATAISGGWEGRLYKKAYVNAQTALPTDMVAGGYCSATGTASATQS